MSARRPGSLGEIPESLSRKIVLNKLNCARGRSRPVHNFESQQFMNRPGGLGFHSSGGSFASSPDSISSRERNPSETSSSDSPCSCNRPQRFIQCKSCGGVFKGRLRAVCHEHPKIVHLMDQFACPVCKDEDLMEFGDTDFVREDGSRKIRMN